MPFAYNGNKKKLIKIIYEHIKNVQFNSIIDAFAGSCSMSLLFKYMNKEVHSNDALSLSYFASLALIENQDQILNNNEINNLLIANKKGFVYDNYLGNQWRTKECRFNKFTESECLFLDGFFDNLNNLDNDYKRKLAFIANAAVLFRLPFGSMDKSLDIMNNRVKQSKEYGKDSENHDRRIGIYYDENFNLNFQKWFVKYANNFNSLVQKGNKCFSYNYDIIDLLKKGIKVDCIYFDPPYGGHGSDYFTLYRFYEEYIKQSALEKDECFNRFANRKPYQEKFIEMLELSTHIPKWIFSFNDDSWATIDKIVSIIKRYKHRVQTIILNSKYRYLYRKNQGKDITVCEYLIVAE